MFREKPSILFGSILASEKHSNILSAWEQSESAPQLNRKQQKSSQIHTVSANDVSRAFEVFHH